jgi:hypothetical protein
MRRIIQGALVLEFLALYLVLKFLKPCKLEGLQLLTLINPADAVPAGQLHTLNPRALINRLRRQLERAGIDKANCFLIGGVDGEWDAGWEVYQPHIHAVVWGITETDLEALVKKWPSDPKRVRVRKRLEPIDDLARVVTYLDKSFWPSVARANNPLGIHPHGKRRPPKHIEAEILSWLHSQSPSDLRLMYGVKLYSSSIVKT